MIKKFALERLSWILFFAFIHLMMLFVASIDPSIPFLPVLYIVFLSALMFLIFLLVRYRKESEFYKRLERREHDLDPSTICEAQSPFERIAEQALISQAERLKRQAERNWQALEQEKDDMLSWIHEMKTPLTAMKLMIDRMEDEKLKSSITVEWLRIHLLLDMQLHQKRLPFMENDLHIERVNLEEIAVAEIRMLASWCIQKGIGFDVRLQEKEVLSDGKWLAFILRQLLSNAVKYSGRGAPDIEIASFSRDGTVFLRIKDGGRGIDPKDLPRIFEKGFTSANSRQDGATGIGLYLAKRAADQLMIDISVQSEPGAGTMVTLVFPKRNAFTQIAGM